MAAQDDFDMLSALAERFELDEDEASNFITSGMKRLGHKARQMWEDNDEDGKGNGGGDFFSSKPANRERRSTTPPPRRTANSGHSRGGSWMYGDR